MPFARQSQTAFFGQARESGIRKAIADIAEHLKAKAHLAVVDADNLRLCRKNAIRRSRNRHGRTPLVLVDQQRSTPGA